MKFLALVPYVLILTGGGLSYVGILPAMIGWALSALGVLSGLGIALIVIFTAQSNLLWPTIFVLLPTVVAIPMLLNDLRYPRINDVTTDVENPLTFVAALQAPSNDQRDMSFPAKNGPIILEEYSDVRPLILDEPLDQVFQRVESLARNQPNWLITRRDAEAHTLEGEATTSVFRFIDDFVIQISNEEGKARINMRSKSRDGLVDAGANANRIQSFFEQLENSEEHRQ